MTQSPTPPVFYVNPVRGNDNATGSQGSPYRTITRALRQATSGSVIRLATGNYTAMNGEVFPIVIPTGVSIIGDETQKGNGTVIEGGGEYVSPTFNRQNVAIRPENNAQLRGVMVVNRAARGTGVWIESTNPVIANNIFVTCGREGVFITGNATPEISDNIFQRNAASGISIVRNAKGDIRRNLCQNTGFGIAISDNAAPLLLGNQVVENRSGVVISDAARPVLRSNRIERNASDGLVVLNSAIPDLGRTQDPGNNSFQGNAAADLRNDTPAALVSVGNQVNPARVTGNINFVTAEVPPAGITPTPAPAPPPRPTPQPGPSPQPIPAPLPRTVLTDITGHWAEAFIQALVVREVVGGFPDNTFKPEANLTRVQYAAAIAKAFNLPAKRQSSRFVDVPDNFWGAAAIARAEEMGFIAGFPDGTFRPNQNLTRVQTIVSLVSGLGLTGGNPNSLDAYSDRAQVPSYAINAVATATQRRMVVNHPRIDQLEPMVDITRAEVVAMIYQALVAVGQVRAIPSPYIVQPDVSAPSFADLEGYWAADFIRGLASQGFISGFADGTFRPDAEMTRAQYAVLMVNTFNPTPKRPAVAFVDVPENFWAAAAIRRAYQGGLMSGAADGTFQPNQNVSRIQVLLSLANGLQLPAGDQTLLRLYEDEAAIPTVARGAVASATANRIVVNFPRIPQLNPNRAATRGEVASMVYQAVVYLGRSPAINSPYIVNPVQPGGSAARSPSPSPSPPPPAPSPTPSPLPRSVAPSPAPSPTPTPTPRAVAPTPTPTPIPAPLPRSVAPTPSPTPPPLPRSVNQLVMIDPGHGGSDPGAIGIEGLREKDVVLAIARQVATVLTQNGLRTAMTRSGDEDLELNPRVRIAEQARANLFVSIHANAISLDRPEVNGLETYHYPGSSRSATLAQAIQTSILNTIQIRDRGVRQANFYVLKNTSMPAVLVEVGFVTGQEDAVNLARSDYQSRMAEAIARGILLYVSANGGNIN
ncbi:N-acetylmuramoyl-L-alanine amidase [Oscillatoria sp. FACHB-1407]|uniref:N-acetylmuramoyl-L-alanine amidase n=1 Tax=Oscillatoria sp. FACHB-1407 TaxID=2692847 RepID=UPI001685EDB1|nr:N-acetylmuramoyl-L-alanine amidase [Oscillatoria sp. FACHB-1407]MBD2461759.1 N-acetylmuramoyl-L-alanine amidase [Oscillatoria sp. FACHB-1407]